MYVITVRNVCSALPIGVTMLRENGVEEDTRAGPAMVMPSPVVTMIKQPAERVLFSAQRDANPAFHLFEAIWMLAGRNDVEPLNFFIRDFGSRFGEPDGTMHGAYGHRWRQAFGIDQLDEAASRLRREPNSRQVVLQMWDATPHQCDDLTGDWKDRPCNTHIYLRVRRERYNPPAADFLANGDETHSVLDMTVCCRSNDVIWGAYGANAVHFSILQEYLAARIGVDMGVLYQISNNFHGYLATMDKVSEDNRYEVDQTITPSPMFRYHEHIDADIADFMAWFDAEEVACPMFLNPWFQETLVPAVLSYRVFRKEGGAAAARAAARVKATDWSVALAEWYMRRVK